MKTTSDHAVPGSVPALPPELAPAAAALASGDYDTALAQLRSLSGAQAQSPHLWRLIADAVQAQGGDPLPELIRWAELDPGNPSARVLLGHTLQDRGELAAAAACYRQALDIDPSTLDALVELGSVEQALGNHAHAVECYQLALRMAPKLHQLYPSLASGLHALERYEEANAAWSKAIRLLGDDALFHYARAESLRASGRLGEALNASERAVKLAPEDAAALAQLASLQMASDKVHDSALNYGKALLADPDNVQAHIDFAAVLHKLGLESEAVSHLRDALRIDARSSLAAGNLGGLLIEMGRHEEALSYLQHALAIEPGYAYALNNMGTALEALGRTADSVQFFKDAIAADPGFIDAYRNLSLVLSQLGMHRESLENSVVAMALAPDDVELLLNLANAQAAMGQRTRAIAHLRKAARLDPKAANIRSNLAHYLTLSGETEEAIKFCREAIALDPTFAPAHSNLIFGLAHTEDGASASRDAGRAFAAQFERPELWAKPRKPQAGRPLHVGFVSGDFYQHAVAGFIEPVLRELAKRSGLTLFAYYNNTVTDHMTATLQQLVHHWRNVHHLSDDALDESIRRDEIDILIDLSGHSGFNRLPVFARKPAPVQVTWIGFPGSTGLRAMDYIVTDAMVLPPDKIAEQFTEQPVYLPAAGTYVAPSVAPSVNPLPALKNGHITFGSFNRANKIHRPTVQIWARLLAVVPDARMLIAGIDPVAEQPRIAAWFHDAGIGASRLTWEPRRKLSDYLGLHNEVDMCLDTTPYSGGTTTLNAVHMGVPTLTLAGNSMATRTTSTVMAQMQLHDWIARDPEDYVARGAELAQRLHDLAVIRTTLRDRLRHSALGDPAIFVDAFENALRSMFEQCLAGRPAIRIG